MDKIKFIIDNVKNKEVLDLGCVAHDFNLIKTQGNLWIHQIIRDNAKEVLGLDYEKKMVDKLNKKGYNILFGDAENFNLKKEFDVVFAGELIEHLSDLKGFLNSVKKSLKKEGYFILTTPNCTRINAFLRILIKGKSLESHYHSLTFSAFLIKNILTFNGFKDVEVYYSNADYKANKNYIYLLLSQIRKEFRSNLVVRCKKNA